ncbi:SET domain-containing protein 4 [Halotydeus destructor]|nr:SET domain-containing protein 4 [Halotydeus destructor]
MLKWMAEFGFKSCSKLKPKNFRDTGRGLMLCQKQLVAGDEIVRIPGKLVISKKVASSRLEDLGYDAELLGKLSYIEILSLFVVLEKRLGNKSFWFKYVQTLPTEFELPLSLAETCKLPESLLTDLEENALLFSESFRKVRTLEPSSSLDEFTWAWSVVNTRCVSMNRDASSETEGALVPYLDLLNHHPEAETVATYDETEHFYILQTLKPYRRHDQVFINYGRHCNRKLFTHYGFIIANNSVINIPVSNFDLCQIFGFKIMDKVSEFIKSALKVRTSKFEINRSGMEWSLQVLLLSIAHYATNSAKQLSSKCLVQPTPQLEACSKQLELKVLNYLLASYQTETANSMLNCILKDEKALLSELIQSNKVSRMK